MKYLLTIICAILLLNITTFAQETTIIPDLYDAYDPGSDWTVDNRNLKYDEGLHLDALPGDGLVWLKDFEMKNAVIEAEIRGKNTPGRSFVGIAFHVENDSTFDAVYFRAFNFNNPERNTHSVQYISHPEFTWSKLRNDHPGKYENKISPVPDPDDWFKVTIEVNHPEVKVYVNDSKEPSLEVNQISKTGKGSIGLWVGHNSEGSFRNLKITKN
jgi:hypothetical protein